MRTQNIKMIMKMMEETPSSVGMITLLRKSTTIIWGFYQLLKLFYLKVSSIKMILDTRSLLSEFRLYSMAHRLQKSRKVKASKKRLLEKEISTMSSFLLEKKMVWSFHHLLVSSHLLRTSRDRKYSTTLNLHIHLLRTKSFKTLINRKP